MLHALKCVQGAPEALFLCMHTVHMYLQVAVFDYSQRFQIEKMTYEVLANELRSSHVS